MPSTYPAAYYFSGELLRLAQAIEDNNPAELERQLALAPSNVRLETGAEGITLLLYSMMIRDKECMGILLTHGFDPNQDIFLGPSQLQVQPVGIAAAGEDAAILLVLLDHGGDPNSRYDNNPALFVAAEAEQFVQLRLLLERGADINATASDGRTAIIALADQAQFDQVAYLIEQGAAIHKPDSYGATLAFAVQERYVSPALEAHKQQQVVKQMLLERGVVFPVPHPGVAFQAKVRQENKQRWQWEATAEGKQWLTRIRAATASLAATAASEAIQMRQQAEAVFQMWRQTQDNWFPSTNTGSLPLYNSA